MAPPLANERLLPLLLLAAGTAICSLINASAATTTTSDNQNADRPPTVRMLAIFDQADMETMERVMQKTLIALNKEKTAWTGASFVSGTANDNTSSSAAGSVQLRGSRFNMKRRKDWLAGRLTVESVAFSSQWWANQTADNLNRLILTHRPIAVLALSADEQSVFRVALAAASFHLPVIGARVQRGLDDSSFRVRKGEQNKNN